MTDSENGRSLTQDERAERERLRAQLASGTRRRTWPRTAGGYVLIALAALLAPLSVVAVWARGEVGDTDRYVETVAPPAGDPSVQTAVTTQLTTPAAGPAARPSGLGPRGSR